MPEKRDANGLRRFLHDGREQLRNAVKQTPANLPDVHVVLGNESADMDSVVSAIARAWHLSLAGNGSRLVLPWINLYRDEIALRKDVQYLLDYCNIPLADVSFVDDPLTLQTLHAGHRLTLHLVDHNVLTPDQQMLSSDVVDIVDHHVDAMAYPDLQQKNIQVVGSCSTLVAHDLLQTLPLTHWPDNLVTLLLAPILMDTTNLTSQEKTTQQDRDVAAMLMARIGDALPPDYYARLRERKLDISGLSRHGLLRKDFKKFQAGNVVYGMSTLVSSEGFWMADEASMRGELEALCRQRELHFLVLLMPRDNHQNSAARRVLLYSHSPAITAAVAAFAAANEFLQARMHLEGTTADKTMYFYSSELFLSRKKLQPNLQGLSGHDGLNAVLEEAPSDD